MLRPPFTGLCFSASLTLTDPLNLPALGRSQPLYITLRFSRDLVFLLNSRLSLVAATISGFTRVELHPGMAPLLPKLRGYFAEFLRESYLAHLGILYLTTCVGLGYEYLLIWLSPLFSAAWHLQTRTRECFIVTSFF